MTDKKEVMIATPVQMRAALELVQNLKTAMIAFVPMPIMGDGEELMKQFDERINVYEKQFCQDD